MDKQKYTMGSRIEHPDYGSGTVTFLGADHVGILLDGGKEILIRYDALARELSPEAQASSQIQATNRQDLPWPDSTFVAEADGVAHAMGSHWQPFYENSGEILKRLPEIVPSALDQIGHGSNRKPPHALPASWPSGANWAWPLRTDGLAITLHYTQTDIRIVSLFPIHVVGSQHTLILDEVTVWPSGLEAHICARWDEGVLTFFDSQYPMHRGWYEAGGKYDFVLSGIAYQAKPAEKREWTITRHPDQVAWLNRQLKEGEPPHEPTVTMSIDGAALFLPIDEWDASDYSFRGPILRIREFKDWLGQDGWKARTTVMRSLDEQTSLDLDIFITRRAWEGSEPPQVGQEIEGRLWLQGYLWMPHFRARSSPI